jgi:hypothetical protein
MSDRKRNIRRNLKIFLPWFLNKELLRTIEGLLPYYYHARFRIYFNRFGCMRCSKKTVMYGCNGLCLKCLGLISDRLKRSDQAMKRRYGVDSASAPNALLKRLISARGLLADFRRGNSYFQPMTRLRRVHN